MPECFLLGSYGITIEVQREFIYLLLYRNVSRSLLDLADHDILELVFWRCIK